MFCLSVLTLIYLWEIYLFPGSVGLFCCRKYVDWSWEYIDRSQTHECGKAAQFPENEYIDVIFFAVYSSSVSSCKVYIHRIDEPQQKNHKCINDIKKRRPNWHRTLAVCRPRQVRREFRMSRQLPEVFISSSLNKEDHYVLKMAVMYYKGHITYRGIHSWLFRCFR
jgi:hypothetical protein